MPKDYLNKIKEILCFIFITNSVVSISLINRFSKKFINKTKFYNIWTIFEYSEFNSCFETYVNCIYIHYYNIWKVCILTTLIFYIFSKINYFDKKHYHELFLYSFFSLFIVHIILILISIKKFIFFFFLFYFCIIKIYLIIS